MKIRRSISFVLALTLVLAMLPAAAVTAYADPSPSHYDVCFDPNIPRAATTTKLFSGSKDDRDNLEYGKEYSGYLVNSPTVDGYRLPGYTFSGWNTKADGTGTAYAEGNTIKDLTKQDGATVTLYAQWTPKNYTVTLASDDPSGSKSVVLTFDQCEALPATFTLGWPSPSDKTFHGWTKDGQPSRLWQDGADVYNLCTLDEEGDPQGWTLNAVWIPAGKIAVSVTEDDVSVEGLGNCFEWISWTDDQVYTMPATYDSNRYIFDTTQAVPKSGGIAGPLPPDNYTLCFDTTLDSNVDDDYESCSCPIAWSGSETVSAVFPYYTISIEKDPSYGAVSSAWISAGSAVQYQELQRMFKGLKITVGETLDNGHQFDGYTVQGVPPEGLQTDDPSAVSQTGLSVRGEAHIKAYGEPNRYTVHYDPNATLCDGSMDDQEMIYNEPKSLSANQFKRPGAVFTAWNEMSGGGGTSHDDQAFVLNLTDEDGATVDLYAQWDSAVYIAGQKQNPDSSSADWNTIEGQAFYEGQNNTLKLYDHTASYNGNTAGVVTDLDADYPLTIALKGENSLTAGGGSTVNGISCAGSLLFTGDGLLTVSGAAGSPAITGTINVANDSILIQESDDNVNWTYLSGGSSSSKRYVRIGHHDHEFTYTAGTGDAANTITAVCTGPFTCEGGYDTPGFTITLNAPTSLTYDKNAKEAALSGYPAAPPAVLEAKPAISYYKSTGAGSTTVDGGALTGAPADAGDYVAQVTWGGETAAVAFSIAKATPVFTVTADEVTDELSVDAAALNRTDSSVPGTLALTETALAYGTNTYHWTFTPDDADNYEGSNGTVDITVSGHDWQFTAFDWTGDETDGYTAAVANYVCGNNAAHTATAAAIVGSEVIEATYGASGKTVYTATVAAIDSPDGLLHVASKNAKVTPALVSPRSGGGSVRSELKSGESMTAADLAKLIESGKPLTVVSEDGTKVELDTEALKDIAEKAADKITLEIPGSEAGESGKAVNIVSCKHGRRFLVGAKPFPFTDVLPGTYYYEAVKWAYLRGVTQGVGPNTFGPMLSCTRAQMVTFLWRAAGCPEPKAAASPFDDLDTNAYYYKAVLWAYENGITTGMSKTKFAPDGIVNRVQCVTFLFRALGGEAAASIPFSDVPGSAYYAAAVSWAAANGITLGTSEDTFSPDDDCLRAQIVTFLYRAYNGA